MNRAQASAGPALMKREKWDCLRVGGMLQQFCDLVNMSWKGSKEGGMERGREGKKKKKQASVEKQLTMQRSVFTQVCVGCRWPRVSRRQAESH